MTRTHSPPDARRAALLLLIGTLLLGLGLIALMPPFEGLDETAHFSYVQQVALTGRWPRQGDPMSAEVEAYLQAAPVAAPMNPPWTYPVFFAAPPAVKEGGKRAVHGPRPAGAAWRPGTIVNWQSQHPPLYYALLAPAYRLTSGWSLGAQFLLLRALSYGLAWAGLALAAYAARLETAEGWLPPAPALLAPALWPLILPMWFPEMARLGNDALVILLAASAWLALRRVLSPGADWRHHLGLGILVGCGLLTKATFMPLAFAVLGVLAARAWADRAAPGSRDRLAGLAWFGAAMLVLSAWWYVARALDTGSLIGSNDAVNLGRGAGLLRGLREHALPGGLLRAPASFVLSFVWKGTWSFVFPPLPTLVVPVGFLLLSGAGALVSARTRRWTLLDRISAGTLLALLAALGLHSVLLLATDGSVAPAWYLHAFLPVFWPILAWGLGRLIHAGALRWALVGGLAHAPAFLAFVLLLQALFWAGCGAKAPGLNYLDLGSIAACDAATVHANLSVVGFPLPGLALALAGWALMTLGAWLSIQVLNRTDHRVSNATPAGSAAAERS